jgi:MtaA/CmuA family methyltransferase
MTALGSELPASLTHRDRFFAVLHGQSVDRVPVFPLLMFFAADRAGISYREYATQGRALAAAQLAVQERFGLDAITACSDAFRLSADLGGEMAYPDNRAPYLLQPVVRSPGDVGTLGLPDPLARGSRQADRVLAVAEMAKAAAGRVAVLGWVDMPFTEACSVCGVQQFMLLMSDDPTTAHRLLAHLTKLVIQFALAQVEAGADMIGAGDAAASLISPSMYAEFALPYEQEVSRAIHAAEVPVKLHICGNTSRLLDLMVTSGADLYNVDHLVPFEKAVAVYSAHQKCFKGNLDPVAQMMQATPEQCRALAGQCVAQAAGTRYMLSAGCEIPAETPDETLRQFCAASEAQ